MIDTTFDVAHSYICTRTRQRNMFFFLNRVSSWVRKSASGLGCEVSRHEGSTCLDPGLQLAKLMLAVIDLESKTLVEHDLWGL